MIFFTIFCWFLDFLLEILKSKRKIWRCPPERLDKYKNAVWPKYYFQKKNSKYEILNHFYFGSNFVSFFGTALGRFSQYFFFTQHFVLKIYLVRHGVSLLFSKPLIFSFFVIVVFSAGIVSPLLVMIDT